MSLHDHFVVTRVAATHLPGGVWVSTVFLGLDHKSERKGLPLLFETRIFGGARDGYQTRASIWDEALAQHDAAVTLAKQSTGAV